MMSAGLQHIVYYVKARIDYGTWMLSSGFGNIANGSLSSAGGVVDGPLASATFSCSTQNGKRISVFELSRLGLVYIVEGKTLRLGIVTSWSSKRWEGGYLADRF
jgi:hypothetical protein